jgi:hypothetical protein
LTIVRLPDSAVRESRDLLRLGGERRGKEHRTRANNERAPVHHSIT